MKGRLFKLGLFLLIGTVVNVAMAWGCALWSGTNPEVSTGSNHADFGDGPTPVSKHIRNFHNSHLVSELKWVYEIRSSALGFGYEAYSLRSFESLDSPTDQVITYALHVGWPSSTLTAYHTYYYGKDDSGAEVDSIIKEWESGILFIVGESGWIPVRPLWPGFAINTTFYAAILWLLTLGPFTARRMIRRKRGRCIKCGYDLRGMDHDKCPECGH